jgi:hypothetical protein
MDKVLYDQFSPIILGWTVELGFVRPDFVRIIFCRTWYPQGLEIPISIHDFGSVGLTDNSHL